MGFLLVITSYYFFRERKLLCIGVALGPDVVVVSVVVLGGRLVF